MCDKPVDDCLAALKFIPDWYVTSKMIKKRLTALYVDDNKFYFTGHFRNAIFSCNKIGILNINLNHINLDDTDYNEDDSEIIIHIRLLAWHSKFEKRKGLKKRVK